MQKFHKGQSFLSDEIIETSEERTAMYSPSGIFMKGDVAVHNFSVVDNLFKIAAIYVAIAAVLFMLSMWLVAMYKLNAKVREQEENELALEANVREKYENELALYAELVKTECAKKALEAKIQQMKLNMEYAMYQPVNTEVNKQDHMSPPT